MQKQCDPDNQFTCNDGSCIGMEQRCDEVNDCTGDDDSDERGCEILSIDSASYRKEYPPIPTRGKKVDVHVNIRLGDLREFAAIGMSYRAKFKLILRWRDQRLTFRNLKNNTEPQTK